MAGKTSKFTEEQRQEMMRLFLEGVTQGKIADIYGCSQATVSRVLSSCEPAKSKTLTAEEQADLIELVGEGHELKELAPDFGCDVATLEYYVRKHKRAESRTKDRSERVVCGDKFSGVLLDNGNGDFHGTFRNADGTFEHVDLHGATRESATAEYEKWRDKMGGRDEDYERVFGSGGGKKLYLVMQKEAAFVQLQDQQEARVLADRVTALTGIEMVVREVVA